MKFFFTILLFVSMQFAYGQDKNTFSKIVFKYSKGSVWDTVGVIGKGEIFELTQLNTGDYKFSKYLKITYNGGNKWKKDTSIVNTSKYQIIQKNRINYLLTQLNISNDNFTALYTKPFLTAPRKKEIMNIALSDTNRYWRFLDKDGIGNTERRAIIRRIKKFDKLDGFLLSEKPDTNYIMVTTDTWDTLSIYYTNKADTAIFELRLYDLLGQPIEKVKHNRYSGKGTLNLEVNAIIAGLLPKSSFLRENIDINTLTKKYVAWYLTKGMKK